MIDEELFSLIISIYALALMALITIHLCLIGTVNYKNKLTSWIVVLLIVFALLLMIGGYIS